MLGDGPEKPWKKRLTKAGQTLCLLIASGIHAGGSSETNPLKAAATAGHVEVAKLLFLHGVDIEAYAAPSMVHEANKTVLVSAAARNQISMMELLLASGASINGKNGFDHSLVKVALEQGQLDAAAMLLEYGAYLDKSPGVLNGALIDAVRKNHPRLAGILLHAGADVHTCVRNYHNVLQLATIHENPAIIASLSHTGICQ